MNQRSSCLWSCRQVTSLAVLERQQAFRRQHQRGLVLLVVLGMLALFTLLAITFLTISRSSRSAAASVTRAKLNQMSTGNLPEMVVQQMISGTNDTQSGFFGHSFLEDIYGRNPIEGEFLANSAELNRTSGNGATILKLQLNPNHTITRINPDPFRTSTQESPAVTNPTKNWNGALLSVNNETYTGRLITFKEGPLAGQTYRILGYWGSPAPMSAGTIPTPLAGLEYAIAIDLAETDSKTFSAVNANSGVAGTLQEWLNLGGNTPSTAARLLIQDSTSRPYLYVINDLPFNGFGYGLEGNSTQSSFGNIDQGRLIPDPLNLVPNCSFAFSVPLALLPNYDYVQQNAFGYFDTGVLGTLFDPTTGTKTEVIGSSNEGFDVADYHDYWMSFFPEGALGNNTIQPQPSTAEIIPAFHRPELVNYIVQTYAKGMTNPGLNKYDLYRMVQLIDYACARPLSYHLEDSSTSNALPKIERNHGFSGRTDGRGIPTLEIDVANVNASISAIQEWASKLIGRGTSSTDMVAWDVDNQGTGTADSVWINPNLPMVTSPEGRQLKVLVAPLILDMDGRLNLNAIGDAIQGNEFSSGTYHTRSESTADSALMRNGGFLPQGLGYGPAEISAAGFFSNASSPAVSYAKFFLRRYGIDEGAGQSVVGGFFDDLIGRYFKERGLITSPVNGSTRVGLQLSRRGQIAYGLDRFGNPRMSDSASTTARTYINTNSNNPYPECFDDPYETSPNNVSANDALIELEELESFLRRYDQDASVLSDRLKRFVKDDLNRSNLTDAIYSSISTRSNELRYPNMAALARHNRAYATIGGNSTFPRINNPTFNTTTGAPLKVSIPPDASGSRLIANGGIEGSFLRWIQLLYQERNPTGTVLELADIKNLFPLEFRKALRLDLNRPFGNGIDDDGDGQIDEPQELIANAQNELYPPHSGNTPISVTGQYGFGYPNYPTPSLNSLTSNEVNRYIYPLQSRKLLARQLYCLAQLIVAQNYPFGGVAFGAPGYDDIRARELAQWAVNVVDFRDTDGAMTRFEYDEYPFTIQTGTTSLWQPTSGNVVWGMEFPDLLLTESLATHDKRVRDTDKDNAGTPKLTTDAPSPDDDFDQYRIPQGSLFLELFCPRSVEAINPANSYPSLGAAPASLYSGNTTLQLGAMTPAEGTPAYSTGAYGPQPVFRIGISHPIRGGGANHPQTKANPALELEKHSFPAMNQLAHQTSEFALTSPAGTDGYTTSGLINDRSAPGEVIQFDRMVWFANVSGNSSSITKIPDLQDLTGSAAERAARVFYNKANANVGLEGGSYLVVGPRAQTAFGSTVPANPLLPVHSPSNQGIVLNGTSVSVYDPAGTALTSPATTSPPTAKAPLTMVAVSEPPTPTWIAPTTGPLSVHQGVGVNISEPLANQYYPMPTEQLNSGDTTGNGVPGVPGFKNLPPDAYADFNNIMNTFPDKPFDYDSTINPILANPADAPNFRNISNTYPNERVAYLQRVADPELPYHPIYNPYITIDWISLDLTVFNGEDDATKDDDGEKGNAYTNLAFQTRYKDGARANKASKQPSSATPPFPFNANPRASLTSRNTQKSATDQTGVSIFSTSTGELLKTMKSISNPNATGDRYFNYVLGNEDPSTYSLNPTTYASDPAKPLGYYSSQSLGYLNTGRQVPSGAGTDWDGFGLPQANNDQFYLGARRTFRQDCFGSIDRSPIRTS